MVPTKIESAARVFLAARRRLRGRVGLAIFTALLPACGEANRGEQGATPTNDDEVELAEAMPVTASGMRAEVLHEFSVRDGQTFVFTLLASEAGASEIAISDQFTNGFDHYAALTERHGLLTSLETFLAFAPEGMQPRPELVEAHGPEALGLGRDDLTVKLLDGFEPQLLVDKAEFSPECESTGFYNDFFILPLRWKEEAANLIVKIVDVDIFGCVGTPQITGVGSPTGCERYGANALLRMYACNGNFGASPMLSKFFTEGAGDVSAVPVPVGTSRRVTRNPFQPAPGQPVITRNLSVRIRNALGGTGLILGGMASL
jgi:hypothetical protein